jgi:hypothetical protein
LQHNHGPRVGLGHASDQLVLTVRQLDARAIQTFAVPLGVEAGEDNGQVSRARSLDRRGDVGLAQHPRCANAQHREVVRVVTGWHGRAEFNHHLHDLADTQPAAINHLVAAEGEVGASALPAGPGIEHQFSVEPGAADAGRDQREGMFAVGIGHVAQRGTC